MRVGLAELDSVPLVSDISKLVATKIAKAVGLLTCGLAFSFSLVANSRISEYHNDSR